MKEVKKYYVDVYELSGEGWTVASKNTIKYFYNHTFNTEEDVIKEIYKKINYNFICDFFDEKTIKGLNSIYFELPNPTKETIVKKFIEDIINKKLWEIRIEKVTEEE